MGDYQQQLKVSWTRDFGTGHPLCSTAKLTLHEGRYPSCSLEALAEEELEGQVLQVPLTLERAPKREVWQALKLLEPRGRAPHLIVASTYQWAESDFFPGTDILNLEHLPPTLQVFRNTEDDHSLFALLALRVDYRDPGNPRTLAVVSKFSTEEALWWEAEDLSVTPTAAKADFGQAFELISLSELALEVFALWGREAQDFHRGFSMTVREATLTTPRGRVVEGLPRFKKAVRWQSPAQRELEGF